jgi:hypothetical protein
MTLVIIVLVAVVAFVVGVLVGRRNAKTVESVVAVAKADISKATGGKVNV